MRTIPLFRSFIPAIAVIVCLGCWADEKLPFVPDSAPSFVVVFKTGATQTEVNAFLQEHLIVGDFKKQFSHRPGIRAVVKSIVEGHDAYIVGFHDNVSKEQQTRIKTSASASPIVLGVFEGVRPGDISLEKNQPQEAATKP
jgi:hypothetical protein